MDSTLGTEEQVLLMATLKFANLAEIKSVDQVHKLFKSFIVQKIQKSEVDAFKNDQTELRNWLDLLMKQEGRRNTQLLKKVDKLLSNTAYAELGIENGVIGIKKFKFPGVQSCYAYAVALLIDRNKALTPFLRRCAAPECGIYFLAKKKRGGKPNYCCEEHKDAAQNAQNLKRVNKYYGKL
ncbi:MAG: hypothetical protein KME62_06040 [Candidatus Thiodiazotropha sp. (ex Ctena orbiculata)]|nr:hypothetical protein [Candidatus Thiodiazotropha taylori]